MDERKKYQKELIKKKIGELRKIAGRFDPPIQLKPSWTRDKIAKLILTRRMDAARDVSAQEKGVSHPSVLIQDDGKQPVNLDFEAAAKVDEPLKDNRGGVRPGAGRKKGMTDEKAKVRHLPQIPSTPIRQGLQSLFDFWASAAKIEELALTEDEAENLSLPITQLQEYYFPGILPEIAGTWIMLIFAVSRVVKPRVDMVNVVRQQRKEQRIKAKVEDGTIKHYLYQDDDKSKPLHAVDPAVPAAYTDELDSVTCPVCLGLINKARP